MTQDQKDLVTEWSDHYVTSAFLGSALPFIKETHWVRQKESSQPIDFQTLIGSLLEEDLEPLLSRKVFLKNLTLKEIDPLTKAVRKQEELLITELRTQAPELQRLFLSLTLQKMNALFQHEAAINFKRAAQGKPPGLSLYRTFDRLDEVLGLNYQADGSVKDPLENTERIYAGAGVGVQSGYSTVLTAFHHLQLAPGTRVIDLGSGYGRVGLVFGLMQNEIDFKGYEFVPHRVENANRVSERLGLKAVDFFACDLSRKTFKIPDADVYYLYDPFSEETYELVLNQLASIGRRLGITIVTKGNARARLLGLAAQEGWPAPKEHDGGNLCLFMSQKRGAETVTHHK